MANNYAIYAPENPNGLSCYSSTPSSTSSSMGLVYADMGSLSLSPKYGVVASAISSSQESNLSKNSEVENGRPCWGTTLPFTANSNITRSFEENPNNSNAAGEGKGSDSSDGFGQNNDFMNHNDKNLNENRSEEHTSELQSP